MDENFHMTAGWRFDPNWVVIESEYLQWRLEITKDIIEIMQATYE
jgi:hypothetical protein